MIRFTKIFSAIFCLALVTSCGKKNGLAYPGGDKGEKRFEQVIEGYDINESDKNFKYYFDIKNPPTKPKAVKKTNPKLEDDLKYSKAAKKTADKNSGQQDNKDKGQQP